MTTLIVNIDRDNDFGEKAGIKGPVVGYSECYNAAVKLITTDPEDSDANALFGAIKHYEELRERGEDVEICLITGDQDVGETSDTELGRQIDDVLSRGNYDDMILVSDGAEDDYIVPVLVSRRKIRYVKHIIVRHNQNIESLYYYIVKALKDKKVVNKFIIPLGIVFLTYGVVSLAFILYELVSARITTIDPSIGAITFVTIVLGGYLLERGFEVGAKVNGLFHSVYRYAQETRVLFLSYVVASMLILVGIASSYVITRDTTKSPVDAILVFLSMFTWWLYGAFFTREVGSAIEMAVYKKPITHSVWYGLLFSLSIAFIVYGMMNYIRYILGFITLRVAIASVFFLILGLVIAMFSSMINRYYSEARESRGEEREQGAKISNDMTNK
ncbi:hypothetical protein GCM10007108_06750 [Thermogymnomonas acidicola]|uniref:DUF373 family protein n=1 Tax=Thermogymnomonas acidicola TaxID=399579 RepID=A0AA37F957_9ARCH|nr:DUF373 family protein [Thermogymnomonas acidicola]GGM71283.1 hypothetical protein GCM10007108_06750 [Thermogymnomonas acidicola]